MSILTDAPSTVATSVIGGVDTHKDMHVAAALDHNGAELGVARFPTTPAGYRALLAWLEGFGAVDRVGVEGTGAWGAGLARFMAERGVTVVDVERPNRQRRRRLGKSDPTDARSAARSALSGDAAALAKDKDGAVEAIRVLRVARRGARTDRTRALNQLKSLVATAPDSVREPLRSLRTRQQVATAAAFRPTGTDVVNATKTALREIARRVQHLEAEMARLDDLLAPLVTATAPALMALHAVGPDTAGALLVAAGGNVGRIRSEAAFARLCGAAPIEASSGRVTRHRLNRGGDREANSALWRIVLIRMRTDERTRIYIARRLAEGRSKREAMRCLKTYVAHEVFRALRSGTSSDRSRMIYGGVDRH